MSIRTFTLGLFFAAFTLQSLAQQAVETSAAGGRTTILNVVVSSQTREPVPGLTPSDFRLLDNKLQRPIISVKQVEAKQEPMSALIVIDAVNIGYTRVAFVRNQVTKFLRSNEGHLAQPTSIVILTDKGAQVQRGLSTDGNALDVGLGEAEIGLREIRRSSGIWGADERFGMSLTALKQLIAYGGTLPGRKLVLWISPGWPLLTGPRIDLSNRQQQQVFDDVVALKRDMRRSNVTLYSVNPLGPEEDLARAGYYQSFLKGINSSSQADIADLSLQVLSVQSGGLVLNSSDVTGNSSQCLADGRSWYELRFETSEAEHPNEYHSIEVQTDKPGIVARTWTGYYAQP
ncbi:hypothetical protein Terro_2978 [Terriglobus roseus DSM 18391]|uniref:VWFA-related domain-containing protein n=1 Tax=Terriglobus roseus (strain DSM 18391 / NRRL B-41598 / KBS 63) TaxID=926566 RepID=I3ZIZ2_TERRK|nr:VWA domain-containing protein [Terriglobus roseus]AFL89210.1 hypothetical protein Terro_2978 [Terriglobus roseus DSM 18391]